MDAARPLTILYFAWLRERVGTAEETVQRPADIRTVAGLIGWLRQRSPGHDAAFENARVIRCAVNGEFADVAAALGDGDEIAFFPPVTGG